MPLGGFLGQMVDAVAGVLVKPLVAGGRQQPNDGDGPTREVPLFGSWSIAAFACAAGDVYTDKRVGEQIGPGHARGTIVANELLMPHRLRCWLVSVGGDAPFRLMLIRGSDNETNLAADMRALFGGTRQLGLALRQAVEDLARRWEVQYGRIDVVCGHSLGGHLCHTVSAASGGRIFGVTINAFANGASPSVFDVRMVYDYADVRVMSSADMDMRAHTDCWCNPWDTTDLLWIPEMVRKAHSIGHFVNESGHLRWTRVAVEKWRHAQARRG